MERRHPRLAAGPYSARHGPSPKCLLSAWGTREWTERSAEEAEARVKEAYDLAVGPHENASFRDVLFYDARCRTDEFGNFTAADVAAAAAQTNPEALSLLALQYPLKKLTEAERGSMLRRMVGPGGLRYQFTARSLRHHVFCRQMV